MTVDKSKFNEIQEIPKGGLLNIQRANGGVLSFDDVEYVPGGGGVFYQVITQDFTVADPAQSEATAGWLVLPEGALPIFFQATVLVAADDGSAYDLLLFPDNAPAIVWRTLLEFNDQPTNPAGTRSICIPSTDNGGQKKIVPGALSSYTIEYDPGNPAPAVAMIIRVRATYLPGIIV